MAVKLLSPTIFNQYIILTTCQSEFEESIIYHHLLNTSVFFLQNIPIGHKNLPSIQLKIDFVYQIFQQFLQHPVMRPVCVIAIHTHTHTYTHTHTLIHTHTHTHALLGLSYVPALHKFVIVFFRCLLPSQGGRGHRAVYYTSPQSLRITFPIRCLNNFGDF